MKKLVVIAFILILTISIHAQDNKFKLSFNDKPIFNSLQYSSWLLIDLDSFCTYRSVTQYGLREVNPFWINKIDKPMLFLSLNLVIKAGILWGTSKLYKKNKFLAYAIVVLVNIVEIYCINTHFKAWRKLK